MCHLDMAAGQRHGVKLSNSKIANYNSSRISEVLESDTWHIICIIYTALEVAGF